MQMPSRSDPASITPNAEPRSQRQPLVVLSHLRWGFVFQRPQHLLTRLAQHYDVFFVEEPVYLAGESHLDIQPLAPGLEVLTPHTDVQAPGFHDDQFPALRRLLANFIAQRGLVDALVWFYTPMALPLLDALPARKVIYDCMDDLASFRFAPPQLVQREARLMQIADVVLTGGPSLYEARKDRRPDIECLPSAVDAAHFAPGPISADDPVAAAALALHDGLARPRLGFFGVIDERLDIDLVAGIADLRPDWTIVMVGPVVKIDPAALPQRPNLRWLGMQSYEALPHLLQQWDVALLPFALNEATRFISPTKTLEYLAGGKPVVSTPIRDVVSLYAGAVSIADSDAGFVAAVEAVLAETPAARQRRHAAGQALVDACTWDGTAARIHALLQAGLPREGDSAHASSALSSASDSVAAEA